MTHSRILLITAAALAVACTAEKRDSATLGPSDIVNASVTAERVPGGARVTNGASATIRFHVLSPTWLGLLVACNTPEAGCRSLAPGASATVENSAIHGYFPGITKLVVRYWSAGSPAIDPIEVDVAM